MHTHAHIYVCMLRYQKKVCRYENIHIEISVYINFLQIYMYLFYIFTYINIS